MGFVIAALIGVATTIAVDLSLSHKQKVSWSIDDVRNALNELYYKASQKGNEKLQELDNKLSQIPFFQTNSDILNAARRKYITNKTKDLKAQRSSLRNELDTLDLKKAALDAQEGNVQTADEINVREQVNKYNKQGEDFKNYVQNFETRL